MGKNSKSRVLKERLPIDKVPLPEDDGNSAFARALGSGDFHTREKGLSALTVWLQRKQDITDDSLRKIWKGIFFCFWHSDKAPVQEDLACRLASLMPKLSDDVAALYLQTFLTTMYREWGRIDKLRLDKFMMMVRKFIHQAFLGMSQHLWDEAFCARYLEILHACSFAEDDAGQQVGFSLHVADVFYSELCKAAAADVGNPIPAPQCLQMLAPLISVMQRTHKDVMLQRIRGSVFEALAQDVSPDSDDASPALRHCQLAALSDALFAAGAEPAVRARNRAALYELSELFERLAAKKRRRREAGDEPAPRKKRKGVAAGNDALGPKQAGANGDKAGSPAAGASGGPEAAAKAAGGKGKKNGAAKKPAEASAIPATQPGPAAAGTDHGESSLKKAKDKVAAKGADPGQGPAGAAPGPATATLSKAAKKRARRASAPAVMHDDENVPMAGVESPATALSAGAVAALTSAVTVVSGEKGKRRITFNLKKNIVHQIGKPLPPSEMRTPPSARPRGAALKRVSNLPTPKTDPVQRKIDFDAKGKKRQRASDFF